MQTSFLIRILSLSLPVMFLSFSQQKNDRVVILVRLNNADSSASSFIKESHFTDLMKMDFKKRSGKMKIDFVLSFDGGKDENPEFIVTVDFTNLKISPEKKEQTTRFASAIISNTTHDKELMEHKIGSSETRTEITSTKKTVTVSMYVNARIMAADSIQTLAENAFTAEFLWQNEFINFNGSQDMLTREEQKLAKAGEKFLPPAGVLYKSLAEAVLNKLSPFFSDAFSKKKSF